MAQLHDAAQAWARLKHRIEELAPALQAVARRLRRLMKRSRVSSVQSGQDIIHLFINKKKLPSKADIVEFFGELRGKEFWKGLPDHVCEYLSFVRPDRAGQRS